MQVLAIMGRPQGQCRTLDWIGRQHIPSFLPVVGRSDVGKRRLIQPLNLLSAITSQGSIFAQVSSFSCRRTPLLASITHWRQEGKWQREWAPEGHRTGANRRLDKPELATCQHSRANMHMSVDLDARESAAAPCRSRRGFAFRSSV